MSRRRKPGKRPNCPNCGAGEKFIYNFGPNKWRCISCKRVWVKEAKHKEDILGERPKCPHCGHYPWIMGRRWQCPNCGKTWSRFLKRKKDVEEERPPCPDCKGTKIISVGHSWCCNSCGRYFSKKYRSKVDVKFTFNAAEMFKTKIDTI